MISRRRFFSLAGRAILGIAALPFIGRLPRAKAELLRDGGIVVGTPIRHEVTGLADFTCTSGHWWKIDGDGRFSEGGFDSGGSYTGPGGIAGRRIERSV